MDVKAHAMELALMAVKVDAMDAMAVLDALATAPIRARITAPKVAEIRALELVKDAQVVQEIAMDRVCNPAMERVLTPAQIHVSGHAQPTVRETAQAALLPARQVVQETAPMTA